VAKPREKKQPISPAARAAAQAEIEHLVANPPPKRPPSAVNWAKEAGETGGREFFEGIMALAIKRTGLTRDEIIRRWGEDEKPQQVGPQEVPRSQQLARARKANMPDKYRESVIEKSPHDCQAFSAVRKFMGSPFKLLMLSGGRGTWKSGSACWAIGQIDGARYVDAVELVDVKLRDARRYDELMSAPLVVLDDLGREDKKLAIRSMFLDAWQRFVINAYTRGRRLIVTANLTWESFAVDEQKGGYGILAADRWEESGMWVDVEGESARAKMRPHWSEAREPGEDG